MIEIRELTKTFGKATAVSGLSFTAADGEVTGFVGPNGAGKSTTMRVLIGLDTATSGEALIDGRPHRALARPAQEIGALLDAGWVHPNRSARAHLRWQARLAGVDAPRADECLELVGLADAADKRVGRFSLGMRQRLGIASALLGEPRHLVLDEPLNGLDPEGVHWMRGLIRDYAAAGNAVLVSSHLLSELAQTADSLVVIGRGRLIGQYSTAAFLDEHGDGTVEVRVDDPAALRDALVHRGLACSWEGGDAAVSVHGAGIDTATVGRVAHGLGLCVLELTARRASLEDAFLRATEGSVEYRTDAA